MRRIFVLFAFFTVAFQAGEAALAQTWARLYEGPAGAGVEAGSLEPTQDGGLVLTTGGGQPGGIMKIDSTGAIAWQGRFAFAGGVTGGVVEARETADGGFLGVGSVAGTAAGTELWVVRMNAQGLPLWQRAYGGASDDAGLAGRPTGDGGGIVGGWTESFGALDGDLWLLKLSPTGDAEWQATYGAALGRGLVAVLPAVGGGYYATGSALAGAVSRAWVLKVDDAGAVLWMQQLALPGGSSVASATAASDGGVILVGSATDAGTGDEDLWLVKLDGGGVLAYGRAYDASPRDTGASVVELAGGGLVVAGSTAIFAGAGSAFWGLGLDAAGAPQWQETYGAGLNTSGRGIATMGATGYALAGASKSLPSQPGDILVVRVDAAGATADACAVLGPTLATATNLPPTLAALTAVATVSGAVPAPTGASASATQLFDSPIGTDTFEEDDSCGAGPAGLLGDGETQGRNFCDDDEDWSRFLACAGRTYTIRTSDLGALADTVLDLYDTDCTTLLASDDNGGGGNASLLVWTAPADGLYHLATRQADATTGRSRGYKLTLEAGPTVSVAWARSYQVGPGARGTVAETQDNGFVASGQAANALGGSDLWVMKADVNGAVEWRPVFDAGADTLLPGSAQGTTGGGAIAAATLRYSGGTPPDVWVLALDSTGTALWQKTFGTPDEDIGEIAFETSDGGFLVGAKRRGALMGIWLLKLDGTGAIQWQRNLTNTWTDSGRFVQETADGGYIVAGQTTGTQDAWVMKLDSAGDAAWQWRFGGPGLELIHAIREFAGGGYTFAGWTESFGAGGRDFWVGTLDASGNLVWQETFGGPAEEEALAIDTAANGDLLVAGHTFSVGAGYSDYWVLRLDGSGNVVWERTYGDSSLGYAYSVEETYDGGVLVGGTTDSPDLGTGLWVLRLNSDGTLDPYCGLGQPTGTAPAVTTAGAVVSGIPSTPIAGTSADTALLATGVPVGIAEQCPACGGALPGEVSPPGAVQPLVFADPTTLAWEDASAKGALSYNVYAAPVSSLLSGWGWCSQEGISGTTAQDPFVPANGEVWFYLVNGENPAGEGPLGTTSWGAPRFAARPCR